MKLCQKCGVEKPENEFAACRSSSDGLFRWCRVCWNEHRRSKYAADPKPFRSAQQKWVKKQKDAMGPCVWCGAPAVKMMKITQNGTSLPTCGCLPAHVVTIGRLPVDRAKHVLSSLSKNDLKMLKERLKDEAQCLKAAFDAVKRFDSNGSKNITREETTNEAQQPGGEPPSSGTAGIAVHDVAHSPG